MSLYIEEVAYERNAEQLREGKVVFAWGSWWYENHHVPSFEESLPQDNPSLKNFF